MSLPPTVLETPCIEWRGYRRHDGYGQVQIKGRKYLAHRVVWQGECGAIPAGMCVLHHCDNPGCVNVEHLFMGTHADNMRDMIAKGRYRGCSNSGEAHSKAKLTETDVIEIRRLRRQGVKLRDIADRFGVAIPTIGHITTGRNWTHLPQPSEASV